MTDPRVTEFRLKVCFWAVIALCILIPVALIMLAPPEGIEMLTKGGPR